MMKMNYYQNYFQNLQKHCFLMMLAVELMNYYSLVEVVLMPLVEVPLVVELLQLPLHLLPLLPMLMLMN
jgi:hypothetical protein